MNESLLDKLYAAFHLYLFVGFIEDGKNGPSLIYVRGHHHESFQPVKDFVMRHQSSSLRSLGHIRSIRFASAEDSSSYTIVALERYRDFHNGLGDIVIFCAYQANDPMARKSSRRTMRRALAHIHEERVKLADNNQTW